MSQLSLSVRLLAVAGVAALLGAAAPAAAQAFGPMAGPTGDIQGFNLAGGGTYVEGLWTPYARFRLNDGADGVDFRGSAQPSFGAEGRLVLSPLFFATGEYRYNRYDEVRLRSGNTSTRYVDTNDDGDTQVYRAGLGVRVPETPFYARAEYSGLRGNFFGSSDHVNGYGAHAGVAQPITRFLGVRAEAGYQDLRDAGRGFAWQAGLNLNLTPMVALTGSYRSVQLTHGDQGQSNRLEEATAGVRVQFN